MPVQTPVLVIEADTFSWEGLDMARRQIRGNQRASVVKLRKLIASIIADDAKPAARTARTAKVKVFDSTVVFSSTTSLADMVANVDARCGALLALV